MRIALFELNSKFFSTGHTSTLFYQHSDASGSVVQCKYVGLIPVVTKDAAIDTEDFGVTLTDDSLDEIEKTII